MHVSIAIFLLYQWLAGAKKENEKGRQYLLQWGVPESQRLFYLVGNVATGIIKSPLRSNCDLESESDLDLKALGLEVADTAGNPNRRIYSSKSSSLKAAMTTLPL